MVAGRYRKVQHLIGPEIFPFWWAALKVTLLVIAAVYIGFAVFHVIADHEARGLTHEERPSVFEVLIFAFGGVTLVCAAIERFGSPAMLSGWKPRELPPVGGKYRGRFDIALEGVFGALIILWWVGLIQFRQWIPTYGLRLELAQVWQDLWWPILGYLIFEFLGNVVAFVRPGWRLGNAAARIVRSVMGLLLAIILLQAGHWVDVSGLRTAEGLAQAQLNIDRLMRAGLAVTALIFAALAAQEAWRSREVLALRGPKAPSPA